MIQRIQTVYLAVAGILLLIPLALEMALASLATESGEYQLTPVAVNLVGASFEEMFSSFAIAGAMAIGLFLTVYAIMQYKNRKFQMRLVQLAGLMQLIIGVLVFVYAGKMAELAETGTVSYSPLLIILIVNLVLYFLAYRGIKKDDELVRSADRLR